MKEQENITPMKFQLEEINKSRLCLFGIAALWIALFHTYRVDFTPLFPRVVGPVLNLIREHGDIGVDIFLLLSGIGLFHSMEKGISIRRFYGNRLRRIIPTLVLTVPILAGFFFEGTLKSYFYNITSLTYWTRIWDRETPKGLFLWYISFLLVLYAVFPLFYKIVRNLRMGGLYLLLCSLALNAVLLFCLPNTYKVLEYGLSRLPIFLAGTWLGKGIIQERSLRRPWIWAISFAAVNIASLYLLWVDDHFIHQLPLQRTAYGMIAITLVFLWSMAASRIPCRPVRASLGFIGTVSLQIYILFETLYARLRHLISYQDETYLVSFITIFCLTLLFSWLIEIAAGKMVSLFREKIQS